MFYTFRQNNSGGYFIQNEDVDVFVIVEGDNVKQIKRRAEDIFKDYSKYCSCCGRRWEVDWLEEEDLDETPLVYGVPTREYKSKWNKGDKIIIHYLNKTKEEITIMEEEVKKEKEESLLKRGREILRLNIENDKCYFVYGLEQFEMPKGIEFSTRREISYVTYKGVERMAIPGATYIQFKKQDGEVSDEFDIKLGSKVIYEKCLEFANNEVL